jgi:serine/threonine protein kinase
LEAPRSQDRPESAPEGGGEPTRELTAAGGQFLLRADVVEFRRGDLLGGRYQIEKGLGRGATGSVLQAFDRVVRSVVAVKILRPDLATDERWIERLGGELRYARKLQHPNVCRVFDLGESDGHHYLTMEFAGAGSLRQRLADKPDRSWEDRIADARAVIEGLVAIHAANIVHRDVKPENVLVMDDGRLVVSDFGVAVSAGQTTYFSSKVAGTPSYMAPEVIMGDKATPRADVFSLGIVLHEILFGRRPDWQMTPKGRVIKSVVGKKGSAREKAFARLCAECLREFAPERLADAAEVRRRFEQAVAGRLRPIVGLRTRWPLAVAAVAVVASVTVLASTRSRDPRPRPVGAPKLVGKAADLGPISRQVFVADKMLRCFDILPDKKTARIVWTRGGEAIDVDLATGQQSPAPLVPESYRSGCPQLSMDGQRLLYVKEEDNKRQIMLSPSPDGSGAAPVTEGTMPSWLPSGEEFLYAFDDRRAATFTLPKTRLLFPDSAPVEKKLSQIAIIDSGDKVALLFVDSRNQRIVEIYSYPSMGLIQRAALEQAVVGGVLFDPLRRTVQISVSDSGPLRLAELTPQNQLSRWAEVRGTDLLGTFRTKLGLVVITGRSSYSIAVHWPDGHRLVLGPSPSGWPSVSADLGMLFDQRLEDRRWVIAYQAKEGASRLLTDGPMDMYPSFEPDGRGFVHVRVRDGAVVSCKFAASEARDCHVVHTDPLGPRFTTVSPDGTQVAYQTTHGTGGSRLRILSLDDGSVRDLGIFRSACPPIWSTAKTVWAYERSSSLWRELDTVGGKPTGHLVKAEADGPSICERAPFTPSGAPTTMTVQRLESWATEIRMAASTF